MYFTLVTYNWQFLQQHINLNINNEIYCQNVFLTEDKLSTVTQVTVYSKFSGTSKRYYNKITLLKIGALPCRSWVIKPRAVGYFTEATKSEMICENDHLFQKGTNAHTLFF